MYVNTAANGPWRNEEQKIDKEKKRYYARMEILQSLISHWKKEREKKEKKTKLFQRIRIWSPIQVLTPPNRAKHVPCGIVTTLNAFS